MLSVNEIIEDQGNLTVYGLTERRFLDSLDSLGLDWTKSDFNFHHCKLKDFRKIGILKLSPWKFGEVGALQDYTSIIGNEKELKVYLLSI